MGSMNDSAALASRAPSAPGAAEDALIGWFICFMYVLTPTHVILA
jgi:hypothetical protein